MPIPSASASAGSRSDAESVKIAADEEQKLLDAHYKK